ncbi:porin family protein [Chryseolinea lacunae]|uniref:PorT family protein n=1 Tax=Chryseolinea lacunae TaxID=2801331 RepID=A0ABS1L078_9BACT|nr:porin family protein [Chryseolinea lacunae]MBL0745111.1 PorT family protein [Chryseolinea lacunae]
MKTKIKLLSIFFITAVLGVMSNNDANAQARAGVKGGLNVSNLYVDDVDDENARYGFNAGVYGQILSTESFAIQPELLYSTKGSKVEYGQFVNQTVKYNLNYLDLPVLAVFKLGDAAEIHLGPYASYLLNANISYKGDIANGSDEIKKDNLKSYDYGLAGGFGLNFGAVQVGARYNYGLVKIADSDAAEAVLGDSKNSFAQLYLSFNLNNAQAK